MIPDTATASNRLIREFARYLGVAFMLSYVALLGAIIDACDVAPLWWVIAAVLAIHGTAVLMFASSFRHSDIIWSIWSCRALCIGYALTVATWPLVWNGTLIDAGHGMWFTQFNGFAAAVAPLVWRVRWSLPYLVYLVVSVQFINEAVRTDHYNTAVLTEIAWSFCLCAMPYAFVVAAIRSVHLLDATRAQSAQSAADDAATVARTDERARLDALTHDRVMSTLLSAARTPMSEELVAQATSTLKKLEVFGPTRDHLPPAHAAAAVREIVDALTRADADITTRMSVLAGPGTRFPAQVVAAMIDAATEAVRNSIRHAGPAATRSLEVFADDSRLCVQFNDDGVGFDPQDVRPDRLGISGSIQARMNHLAGGSAEVVAARGQGTSVRLLWSRP